MNLSTCIPEKTIPNSGTLEVSLSGKIPLGGWEHIQNQYPLQVKKEEEKIKIYLDFMLKGSGSPSKLRLNYINFSSSK